MNHGGVKVMFVIRQTFREYRHFLNPNSYRCVCRIVEKTALTTINAELINVHIFAYFADSFSYVAPLASTVADVDGRDLKIGSKFSHDV